tara:strand:+ start:997 stop:1497 length:501 start_codon:yes stop_codon:yes gene_type:complete
MTTPSERRFCEVLKELCDIARDEGWGDPLNYGRSREIDLAIKLGHRVSDTLAGADAFDQDGNPVEYKTTTQDIIQGTYNGVSVFPTWEEQEAYLREEKIGKYKHHYFARYDGSTIKEAWVLTSEQVLEHLLPKFKTAFESKKSKKDPRLGCSISADIIREGEWLDI